MKGGFIRVLGVVAAALLITAVCTNSWLDHDGDQFGLLGLRVRDVWIWHSRWIEIAREMNEPITRMVMFTSAGIATLVASAVASLALLAMSLRTARWSRVLAFTAIVVAIVASLVFLATKPELEDSAISQSLTGVSSGYVPSWSLIAFGAGVVAAIFRLRASTPRSPT